MNESKNEEEISNKEKPNELMIDTEKTIENKNFQNLSEEEKENTERISDLIINNENKDNQDNNISTIIQEENIIDNEKQNENNIYIQNNNNTKEEEKIDDFNKTNQLPDQTINGLMPDNNLKRIELPLNKISLNNKQSSSHIIIDKSPDYDPQYEKYKENIEDGDGQKLDENIKGKDSIKTSGAQIANTIMGAGILSIPIVMRYLGLFIGIVLIISLAFCTIYSVYILIRCHEITGKNGFSMLGKITMGKFGSILIKIIIIINNLGFCIAYFRIFGEVFQTIIQGWVSPDSFWATNWHNYFYILLGSLIMFYFIFSKNLSALKKVAFFGVTTVLIFSLSLTLLFIHKGLHNYLDSDISWKFFKPNCTMIEAFHAIPSVFLAFLFQFNVFPIYLSLKEKNIDSMMKATKIGVGYSLFIFLLVGIVGFLLYGLKMNETILNSLSEDMEKFRNTSTFIKFLIIIISISFVTTCLTSFPILFLSLKENFVNSIIFCVKSRYGNKNNKIENFISQKGLNIISILLYILIITMAILLPRLKIIFSILGITAGTFIAFILPNLFYIKICKMSNKDYDITLPIILLTIGVFFLFFSVIISFT